MPQAKISPSKVEAQMKTWPMKSIGYADDGGSGFVVAGPRWPQVRAPVSLAAGIFTVRAVYFNLFSLPEGNI